MVVEMSGRLGTLSEGPRCRPVFPGVSGPCLRARSVHQHSRMTQTVPEGLGVEQLSRGLALGSEGPQGHTVDPGDLVLGRRATVSTTCPGQLGAVPQGPIVDQHSRTMRVLVQGPAVNQRSLATRARARCPAGSASGPGQLRPWSERLRCRPGIQGDSGPCPRAHGVDQLSRLTRSRVRGTAGSTSCPG